MLFRRSSCRTTLTPLSVRFTTSGWALGGAVIFFGGTVGGRGVSTAWADSTAGRRSAPRKREARGERREAQARRSELAGRSAACLLSPLASRLYALQPRVVAWRSSDALD